MQSKVFLIEPDTYYRVKFQYEDYEPFWKICWCPKTGGNLYTFYEDWEIDWDHVLIIQPVFRMDESTGKFSRLNGDVIIESQNV